jgi:D-sedoheptulose 7-phosphate isomerase
VGAVTVAWTGESAGACEGVADLVLRVPSQRTARVQEAHLTIGHILCGLVEHEWCER